MRDNWRSTSLLLLALNRFWNRGDFTGLALIALVALVSGCTAIPLDRLYPSTAASGACQEAKARLESPQAGFVFVLPKRASARATARTVGESGALRGVERFSDFVSSIGSSKEQRLPRDLTNDAVTNAVFAMMVKTSARAQLELGKATGARNAEQDEAAVAAYPVPSRITHRQLKAFADKFFDLQLRPTLMSGRRGDEGGQAFAGYFEAYYNGKFVDRLGMSVQKPSFLSSSSIPLNLTIPNADIAAAFAVLLEYMIDLFDPTPVMGDTKTPGDQTKFYPGGKVDSRPTALGLNFAEYRQLPASGCGVTIKSVPILSMLAHAAGDRATALGGLVSDSFGGLGVSFGGFGKVSIGDNQTVATLVKTAASRVAARATFAAGYWALEGMPQLEGRTIGAGGGEAYLSFPP